MIETRDPNKLAIHPEIESMPRWRDDDAEWHAFVADIADNGVKEPVCITADDVVVDGWTRCRAAIRACLDQVPVRIVQPEEVFEVILRGIRRRNITKGAKAYIAFPKLRPAYEEAVAKGIQRKLQNLRKGQNPNVSPKTNSVGIGDNWVGVMGEGLGLSDELMRQAARVWEIFEEDPAYRDQVEPEILSGEMGLGAVIQGYAGRQATIGRDRPPTHHWMLISKSMASWKAWPRYWQHLDDAEKSRIRDEMQQGVAVMPAEARHMLATAIRLAEKKAKELEEA